jgi:hypothetical protein
MRIKQVKGKFDTDSYLGIDFLAQVCPNVKLSQCVVPTIERNDRLRQSVGYCGRKDNIS